MLLDHDVRRVEAARPLFARDLLDTGPTFRPGGLLAGHVQALSRDTPVPPPGDADMFRERFWSDGTARLPAYEYVGLTQSPCFRGGQFPCAT